MSTQVQFRRGDQAATNAFKGALGEVTVNTSNNSLVVHDATTVGGFEALRADGSNSSLAIGSTSNCALKFAGDPNTGLIRPYNNAIALVTAGSTRLTIDGNAVTAAGNVVVSGNLTVAGSLDSDDNLALIVALS